MHVHEHGPRHDTGTMHPGARPGHRVVLAEPRRMPAPHLSQVLGLQRAAGNGAVAGWLAPQAALQRAPTQKPLNEVIEGTDPDALKPLRPFPALTAVQLNKICRLVIDKNTWVGPDDEKTLEAAWRAAGGLRDTLTEKDWALWKECEKYGAEIGLVPWMREMRTTFADRVRAAALENVQNNVESIGAEAKRLGLAVGGGTPPAPTRESDEAVAQQRGLAAQIRNARANLKALGTLPVGYGVPTYGPAGDKPALPPGGTPEEKEQKRVVTFDPDKPPFMRSDPDPNPAAKIAKYEAVKAIHDEMSRAIALILNNNPALYAIAARGSTDAIIAEDTAAVRKQMTQALSDVLGEAAKTRANIESRALNFSEMMPVHQAVSRSDPQFQSPFMKKLAADYIAEEGGAEAAGNKLVSLLTIALITAVSVASGGAATPIVAAAISLASSAGSTVVSWNEWAKLETAAKSTVSDKNAIVTQEQADSAMLGALISTATAMIDVYGVAKAASAGARAAVTALEGRVSDVATLKQIAGGAAAGNAREVLERSVTSLGPATTVRTVGSWQKLTATLGAQSPAMGKLEAWRGQTFRAAEQEAVKAAAGKQGEAARAALALASGIEQAALGEALDAVIEIVTGEGGDKLGQVGVGGKTAEMTIEQIAAHAGPQRSVSRSVQRSMIETVEVPFSELRLASMSPAEFERIIRQGVSSGYFARQGLPRMTVLDAKLHGGGHGYDGLGISKQGNLIQLYNLECKHVIGGSEHLPELGKTQFGTQGGLRWNEAKARMMLSADNPFAEETLAELTKAIKARVGRFDERILEDTLGRALRDSRFYLFTPAWARTETLLAQMRGFMPSGLAVGKLIRVAPRRRG